MLRIGLEASRANKEYKTGTEWYAWHLLQQFKKLDTDHSFFVYYNQELASQLKQAPANFKFVQLKWPLKKLWTHIRLGFKLLTKPVDKFLFTNAVPLLSRGEVIVTIHDLGFLKNPELYHPLERIYQKLAHNIAISKAKKIITVSEASKQDIIKYYPKVKDRIKVIYLGWDEEDFKPGVSDSIKEKYNLPDNYILYIGRVETKKNIQNLIKGYKLLKTDWPLVLAGRPGNYGYNEIKKLANDKVIFLGYIPQTDYPQLLASAKLFVFPSKFEGFGMPILEAMASGVPVVCSDMPVLHEVGNNAVSYFNPDDINDIAEKLQNLIDDRGLRQELIDRGLEKVKQFSWSRCARQTLEYILE